MQKCCRVSLGTGQILKGRKRPKAVKTKVDKLTKWAESVHIEYDFPNSVRLHGTRREKVNYLRHECTTYDDTLDDTYGSVQIWNFWNSPSPKCIRPRQTLSQPRHGSASLPRTSPSMEYIISPGNIQAFHFSGSASGLQIMSSLKCIRPAKSSSLLFPGSASAPAKYRLWSKLWI